MAAAKTSRLFSAAVGAAAGIAAAVTPVSATAQDAAASAAITEELSELREATRQAIAYAEQNGVAILLHVGEDIQNHDQSEALLLWVQDEFRKKFAAHDLDVGIFPSTNLDGRATVLTYHVGDHIYVPDGSNGVLNLQEADAAVPDVAEQAHLARQLAAAQQAQFTPTNPGG
ncbi:MAG: hypothetical protein AAFR02_10590 [Pseudomonadota bacterium]